jgi:hypothetical protein
VRWRLTVSSGVSCTRRSGSRRASDLCVWCVSDCVTPYHHHLGALSKARRMERDSTKGYGEARRSVRSIVRTIKEGILVAHS